MPIRRKAVAVGLVALTAAILVSCSDSPPKVAKKPGQILSTWVSGSFGNLPTELAAWGAWRGRPSGIVTTFTARDDWNTMTTSGFPLAGLTPDKFSGKVSIGEALFPRGGSLAACARGDYDGHWADFGRTLIRYRRPAAYVRLGWEFNGNWFWWGATDVAAWKSCFQRSVTAIRSTDPRVIIEWNLSAHRDRLPVNGQPVYDAYPGDAYVDDIAVDAYDSYPGSTTQTLWNRQCHSPSGLCTAIAFARAHGKKFSVPEWGVVRSTGGAGDNPFFIAKMYQVFKANKDILAYEAYFNIAEKGNVDSSLHDPDLNPSSAREYQRLFGSG